MQIAYKNIWALLQNFAIANKNILNYSKIEKIRKTKCLTNLHCLIVYTLWQKKASLEMLHFIKMNMPGNNNEYTTQPI